MAMLAVVATAFGAEGLALCVGQAALSVWMLESANYVQHYGLQRSKLENGRSEPLDTSVVKFTTAASGLRTLSLCVACDNNVP